MNDLKTMLHTTVIKDSAGVPVITVAHLAAVAVGALGLYLMIPERKRKNLMK